MRTNTANSCNTVPTTNDTPIDDQEPTRGPTLPVVSTLPNGKITGIYLNGRETVEEYLSIIQKQEKIQSPTEEMTLLINGERVTSDPGKLHEWNQQGIRSTLVSNVRELQKIFDEADYTISTATNYREQRTSRQCDVKANLPDGSKLDLWLNGRETIEEYLAIVKGEANIVDPNRDMVVQVVDQRVTSDFDLYQAWEIQGLHP